MARATTRALFRFQNTIFTQPTIATPCRVNPEVPSSPFSISNATTTSHCGLETRGTSIFDSSWLLLSSTCQSRRHFFQIQTYLITSGLFRNPFLSRTVLRRASEFCDIDYTILIFRYIGSFDTFCVNTVIQAYCGSYVPEKAVVFYFQSLRDRFFPNSYTFVPLFGACEKMGCVKSGQKCHGQAVKNGVDCMLQVQNSLIHMYGCCGDIELARDVFDNMLTRDSVSWNSIIGGYVTFGDFSAAHSLFDKMPDRNVVSWNVMISGFAKAGNPGYGLKLFREMFKAGIRGNARTIVNVLIACGRTARLKEGRSVHGHIIKMFIKSNLILDTALIDMYSKCQRLNVASTIFRRLSNRNLICWNAMILGHCIHGNPVAGLHLFDQMVGTTKIKHEVKHDESSSADGGQVVMLPDEITFIGILCACARAEQLTEGMSYFKQMTIAYGLKPNFAHFWCMANLLANVGRVHEAEEFLRKMVESDEDISSESLLWARMLGLCRFKKDVSMGEKVAKFLIDKEPKNFAYYHFLLNVYAAAGQWENVSRVIKMVNRIRPGRVPGCSLVDLKQIVHEFEVSQSIIQVQVKQSTSSMDGN